MNVISIIMAFFALLGALDLITGNRIGIGKEFERGIKMTGMLSLTMIGMIVLAPLLAHLLFSPLTAISSVLPIEPSVVIASLLANDMGGAQVALQFAGTTPIGYFNGLIVASMLGATVSFTLPFALKTTQKEQQKKLLSGLLCGICTIPLGCFVAGLFAGIPVLALVENLIPIVLFSALLAFGLFKFPKRSVQICKAFGWLIQAFITAGLAVGIFESLTGWDVVPYTAPIEEGVVIVFNVAMIETGAFPLVFLLSKALQKPLKALGQKAGLNEVSAVGFLSTLATNVTTFGVMKDMDEKGVVLNSAFAVSSAFTFADHLAFTLSFHADYLPYMIIGKLVAGVSAVVLASVLYRRQDKERTLLTEKRKSA